MLQRLRQYRRELAGSFGSLLAIVWLSLVLAPCLVLAEAPDSGGPAHGTHHDVAKTHDCGHCDTVETSCTAIGDSHTTIDTVPLRDAGDTGKLKFVALSAEPVVALPDLAVHSQSPSIYASPPAPHASFTTLYCRFRE